MPLQTSNKENKISVSLWKYIEQFFSSGKGGREENAKDEEEIFLHEILNVIEKRDLLLLELEIERRRCVHATCRESRMD